MEKANNFQIAEFQAQGLVWILLYFRQFQPGVAYKKACSLVVDRLVSEMRALLIRKQIKV